MSDRPNSRFLVVCLNPTLQKTLVFDSFAVNEVNRVIEGRLDASGKGVNVARVLSQLGEDSVHLTHLGGDRREQFEALCRDEGFTLEVVPCETPIRGCITAVDRSSHTTTEIVEPTQPITPATEREIVSRYRVLVPDATTVIFSGTTAPGYSVDLFARMIAIAREHGAFVIADFRGEPLKAALENVPEHRPQLIKPNLKEFAQTFLFRGGETVSEHATDQETLDRTRKRMERLANDGITTVITRGAHAALAIDFTAPSELIESTPLSLKPMNTIGCGDAFTAGLAAELSAGGTLRDAMERGHASAAMNAAQLKPGSIRPE